ncbi:TonB-dependent receptor, partial [Phenylobacterium sp.]|uniref:TonB-dependent receptor n=1 Tax=Phenylobacterium sp. TaxID=1871053 RepID=UPI00378308F8
MIRHTRMLALLNATAVGAVALAAAGAASAQVSGSSDAGVLEEVIVTATRTDQALSRVPISVAAYTQEALDDRGIRRVDDITRVTPGVNFSRSTFGLQTQISIRGISSTAGTSTTGIYLDDTPIQVRTIGNSSGNAYPAVFDLERVEILRGPQGTLFGAGSQGGTVRFISPLPSLTDYSVYGRAEIAATKSGAASYEFGAAMGGPIVTDKIGFRVSAYARRDGGFVDRIAYPTEINNSANSNWVDTKVVRAALTFAPDERLRITPSVYYQNLFSHDSSAAWLRVGDRQLSNPGSGDYRSGTRVAGQNEDWFVLPAIKTQLDLGAVSIVSDTSYFFRTEDGVYDYTAYMNNTFGGGRDPTGVLSIPGYFDLGLLGNKQNNWTQEVRISSTDREARLTWVVGGFYSEARQSSFQILQDPYFHEVLRRPVEQAYGRPYLPGGVVYTDTFVTLDKQIALFGEANLRVIDGLTLTAGLRYSKNELEYRTTRNGPTQGGPGADQGTQEAKPLTPKFTISYELDDRNLVYATAAKGFRLGGVNRGFPTVGAACISGLASIGYSGGAPRTFESDSVWSYEIGSKNRFADDRLRVATSVYQIDWKNIIRSVGVPGCGFSFFANLGEARSRGFDVAADFVPVSGLTLTAQVGYNDVEFTKSIRVTGATSDIVTKGHTLGGNPWSVSLSAQYEFVGPGDLDSYVRADFDYRQANDGLTAQTDPRNSAYNLRNVLYRDPDTKFLNLRAGVKRDGLDMSVFVKNATDSTP